jgi:hypothetical protein
LQLPVKLVERAVFVSGALKMRRKLAAVLADESAEGSATGIAMKL